MKEVSKFFGGNPIETTSSTEVLTAPPLNMPKIQYNAPVGTTTKKKKKEGC